MMIRQSIKKEFILVFSDLHSVAVLLIMPVIFMLLMTFAMSERQEDMTKRIPLQVSSNGEMEAVLYVKYLSGFGYNLSNQHPNASASLILDKNLKQALFSSQKEALIDVEFNINTSPAIQAIITQHIQMAFARLKLHLYMLDNGELEEELTLEQQVSLINQQTETSHYIAITEHSAPVPVLTYSVPSWLVFGIYFIVMPISLTLLNEVKSGTLIRLKTFPVNLHFYFLVKLLTFYIFSMGQFLVLSFIGWRVVPLIVDLPPIAFEHISMLALTGLIVCIAAVSFAAIIATLVSSFEQAIVLGGGVNIILAAFSGFMVPLDIMPSALQNIALLSPMYWSAELVKGAMSGSFSQHHWLSFIYLGVFTTLCLGISAVMFSRRIRNLTWN